VRGVPITVAHGIRDGTNPIERVREDITQGTVGLINLVRILASILLTSNLLT
jgi:hypothetical protein